MSVANEVDTCTICGGTGWKIVERSGLSGAERCACYGVTRGRELRDASGLPAQYAKATLDNFEATPDNPIAATTLRNAILNTKGFLREFPATGLLLIGEAGAGKTHLAVAAMKVLLERGHECVFFDYQNLIDRIRSGWDSSAGTADKEAYRSALETEVLVLDDLGSNRPIDWVMDTVTAIITHRYNNRKPLIATTNLSNKAPSANDQDHRLRKTMPEVIGERAWSRLNEMCRVVDMSGVPDHRLKRAR